MFLVFIFTENIYFLVIRKYFNTFVEILGYDYKGVNIKNKE